MRVTFDTNTYRPVAEPQRFMKHADQARFVELNAAVSDGRIKAFMGEALFTIEAIQRVARAEYLAERRPQIEIFESTTPDGKVRATVTVGPDHAQHPGLSQRETERLEAALTVGFRLLAQPRFGTPRPEPVRPDLHPERFAIDTDVAARQELFGEVCRAIEDRGVGFARAKMLGDRARNRMGRNDTTWFELLNDNRFFNDEERKELAAAVGEWVDGDNIAAHVAYGNDVFCTEDKAGKGRPSVLNSDNRQWLGSTYGVRFANAGELHTFGQVKVVPGQREKD